jgi:hypothetical protein
VAEVVQQEELKIHNLQLLQVAQVVVALEV